MLLAELRRIGPAGRKEILDQWSPFLPTYVDPQLSLMNAETLQKNEDGDDDEDEEDPMINGLFTTVHRVIFGPCYFHLFTLVGGFTPF